MHNQKIIIANRATGSTEWTLDDRHLYALRFQPEKFGIVGIERIQISSAAELHEKLRAYAKRDGILEE